MSIIYIIAAACSLLSLIAYSIFIKKKHQWFWVFFASIMVINAGYYALSNKSNTFYFLALVIFL